MRIGFSGFLLLLVLFSSLYITAQTPEPSGRKLLHGSIFTLEGKPAVNATVEIRDLRGIKLASALTDSTGNYEMSGAVEPGEYVFLAARALQIKDERILLDRSNLEMSMALPPAAVSTGPATLHSTVSAKQLAISGKVRTHLTAAQRDFSQLNLKEALQQIDAALLADSTCAQAFSMRAFIELAMKDTDGAAEDAKRAASLDPEDAESFIAMAMSYNTLREFQKAADAARHALSLHPDSWQGRLELAKSFYGQGEFVLGLRELDFGNVDFPDAHLVRGNILMRLGRTHEAGEEFGAFLREAPDDSRGPQISQILATQAKAMPGAGNSNQ